MSQPILTTTTATTATTTTTTTTKHNNNNNNNKKHKKTCKLWKQFDEDIKKIKIIDDINDCATTNADADTTTETEDRIHTCFLCDTMLVIENGVPICVNSTCGVVYTQVIDHSPEWRGNGNNGDDKNGVDPTRCGAPINPLLQESSFGCKILCGYHSSYEMKKIAKWTKWQSAPHKEKTLYHDFQYITIMAKNAGIPQMIIDYALIKHKDNSEQIMFRGVKRASIIASSIYVACMDLGHPRTPLEIAQIFNIDKKSATEGCSIGRRILNNIQRNKDTEDNVSLSASPSSFIERFCTKLNMNTEQVLLCSFIANKVETESLITDNMPHAIAAGIVFYIANIYKLPMTKNDVSVVSGISEVTINKCYKKLETYTLVPSCFKETRRSL